MLIDFDDEYASIRQWAKMYFDLGLQVVPAYKPGERDQWKRPALKNWTHLQKQKMSEEDFNQWWGDHGEYINRHSLGFINGYVSGDVFTIDIDSYKDTNAALWLEEAQNLFNDGKLFNTPTQTTGGGGKQLLFRAPPGWSPPTSANPVMGIDIRGEGGFAMLPPSNHTSGKQYAWDDDYEPWTTAIMMAPEGFCAAIDELFGRFNNNIGGPSLTQKALSTVKMPTPAYKEDAFGGVIDGREDLMFRWVFKALVVLHIETNGEAPTVDQERESFESLCHYWIDKVDVQDQNPPSGLTKEQLLDRENRGPKLLWTKWRHTMQKHWTGRIAEAAKNPRKKDQREFNSQGPFVANNIEQPPPNPTRFTVLNYQDIMSMPDPVYMVDGLIIENSFTFIAGDPGAGKSFAAMSLMMAVANKKPTWMGRDVKKHGAVIYISTEGNNDMKFRLKAWESEYGRLKEDPPIHLIPDQMNLLVEQDVDDLIATIESKIKEIGQKVELIVFDTVSNNIPGADENLQKDVTLFVRACTKIKIKFQTTVVGVHHLSRNGNGQMRGSTVLDGSADTIMIFEKVKNDKTKVKMTAKKIKSAEDGWHELWGVKKVAIGFNSSLVLTPPIREAPKPSEEPFGGKQQLSKEPDMETCRKMVAAIHAAWVGGYPWSRDAKSRDSDRYAPDKLVDSFNLPIDVCEKYVAMWHRNDVIVTDTWGEKGNKKGLRKGKGL